MPIRPENRARYPANWKDIRAEILARAKNCCEHKGCKARHLEEGYWYGDEWVRMPARLREAGCKAGSEVAATTADGSEILIKLIRIVLTVAHLDHTPENCDPANLRAWCQRHHLAYDAKHHAVTAARTRHANANTLEMFE
jgi:hypothetical protein